MALAMSPLYPYFGGKSQVADLIWEALGDPAHYIEPCYGGGAVHLARPHAPKVETLNDLNHYIVNFLRATRADPAAVAAWCVGPVAEADLHARHHWLLTQGGWDERVRSDPTYYDVQIAGWWLWGQCAWLGSGWCEEKREKQQLPFLSHAGHGIHRLGAQQLPFLSHAGHGIHRLGAQQRPDLHRYGQGILAKEPPALAALQALAHRLSSSQLRICCGDWQRVCTPAVLGALGTQSVGIFLDPPYSKALRAEVYSTDTDPAAAMAAWARRLQDRPNTRLVLCGYGGEHAMPGWTQVQWKARGGMGNQGTGRGRANATQECLWFSPQCHIQQLPLFS